MDHENRNWSDVPDDELEDACMDENPGAIEEHYTRELRLLRADLKCAVAEALRMTTERDKYKGELERLRANLGSICSDPNCNTNNPRT